MKKQTRKTYVDAVRRALSGEGLEITRLCKRLKLSDKQARGAIDGIRAREGRWAAPRQGHVFRYLGDRG